MLLEHAAGCVPDPEPSTGSERSCCSTRPGSHGASGGSARWGRPRGRGWSWPARAGDVRLLSSALDAVSARAGGSGRFREDGAEYNGSASMCWPASRRRASWSSSARTRPDAGEVLVRVGDLRGAIDEEIAIAPELLRKVPHIGVREVAPAALDARRVGRRGRGRRRDPQRWEEEGRPPFAPFAGEIAAVGSIHGVRGDEVGAEEWFRVARERWPASPQRRRASCARPTRAVPGTSRRRRSDLGLARIAVSGGATAILVKRAEVLAARSPAGRGRGDRGGRGARHRRPVRKRAN